MTHEWKVGDRFSVEGVITETADSDGDYKAIFDGHTIGGCVIAAEMACAKLIHPAAPEPQKLDISKPMRLKGSGKLVKYIDRDEFKIVIRFENGYIEFANEDELENIPEPKRTTTQIVQLVNFNSGPQIVMKSAGPFYVNVASHAKISYTDGEGWRIEEVEDEG